MMGVGGCISWERKIYFCTFFYALLKTYLCKQLYSEWNEIFELYPVVAECLLRLLIFLLPV